jgi:hypothetical protein
MLRALSFLPLCLALPGCGLPEYRIFVSNIPSDGAKLEAAAYLPSGQAGGQAGGQGNAGVLPTDRIAADLKSGQGSVAVTVNFGGPYEKLEKAVFSAIVRDAKGCISAVGTSEPAAPSSSVADLNLALFAPRFLAASADRCAASQPIIVDVQRQEQGSYGKTDFRLLVSGWDFAPDDVVTVKSTIQVPEQFCQYSTCTSRCSSTLSCVDAAGTPGACRTGCTMITTVEYVAPGRFMVHIPESANRIANTAAGDAVETVPVTLAEMRATPFQVTISRPASGRLTTFTEQKVEKP